MEALEQRQTQQHRRTRGTSMLTTLFALGALLAAAAFAMDAGSIWLARTQLQAAVDAAALAAAQEMIDLDSQTVDKPSAQAAAFTLGMANGAFHAASIGIDVSRMEFGQWNFPDPTLGETKGTLDTSVDQDDPNVITGVRVYADLGMGGFNSPIPALLGRVLGNDTYDIAAQATGFLGFEGGALAKQLVIPIAVDCCKMGGSSCTKGYCADEEPQPPNPCSLEFPQTEGENTVSCIISQPTADQVGCWTELSTTDQATNTSGIRDVIQGGGVELSTDDSIYVTNGTNAAVLDTLKDKFDAEGKDRYEPIEGTDSWVRALPVVECQSHELKLDHCAKSTPKRVVGFICFEMREVKKTPEHVVRGRFLCPNNDFDRELIETECDLADDGSGLNFGIRVSKPVLVD